MFEMEWKESMIATFDDLKKARIVRFQKMATQARKLRSVEYLQNPEGNPGELVYLNEAPVRVPNP